GPAEDLRLDLARERHVVELLRLLAPVDRLLRQAVDVRRDPAARPSAAAQRPPRHPAAARHELMPAPLALPRVEEERDERAEPHAEAQDAPHAEARLLLVRDLLLHRILLGRRPFPRWGSRRASPWNLWRRGAYELVLAHEALARRADER